MKKLMTNEILKIIKSVTGTEFFKIGEYKNNFFIRNNEETLIFLDKKGKVIYKTEKNELEQYIKTNSDVREIISKIRMFMLNNPSKSYVYATKERFLDELGIEETLEQKTIKILRELRNKCVAENRIKSVEDITRKIIQLSDIQVDTREYDGITIITFTEGKLKSELRLSNEMLNKESKSLIQEFIYQHFLQHHGEDIELKGVIETLGNYVKLTSWTKTY